ncbi:MAG: hypothetical protein ACQEQV_06695 [Fibrobacterota bacterium]
MSLPKGTSKENPDKILRFSRNRADRTETEPDEKNRSFYDLTDSLFRQEEESAKRALRQLWVLKNNLNDEQGKSTITMLIDYYQNKIDMLRDRKREIQTISGDSKELLSQKQNSEKELHRVRSTMQKCDDGIKTLQRKRRELEAKEAELQLITGQIDKELNVNNSKVVNGLYEIVLNTHESADIEGRMHTALTKNRDRLPESDIIGKDTTREESYPTPEDSLLYEEKGTPLPVITVKTENDRVISEYYVSETSANGHSPNRMIYNSRFLARRLEALCSRPHDRELKKLIILSIRDLMKRREQDRKTIRFEVHLNEIINPEKLRELEKSILALDLNSVKEFSRRLSSKIKGLGNNYEIRLREQMQSLQNSE